MDVENELLGIGRMSSLSGLPHSALRFYDGAGVLRPAVVDPASGYRFYRPDQVATARLVAHLRRVDLPLADIAVVLREPAQATRVLTAHLDRLEAGLADARREISIVRHLLEHEENTVNHCTLPAADLIRALRDVRYAVGDDPDTPRLAGVYLDSEPGRLRVVATDRYRLVVSMVTTSDPVDLHLLLPTSAVDELLGSGGTGTLDVVVADGEITLSGGDVVVRAEVPDVDFPPYRSWLELGRRREVTVDSAALCADLDAGDTHTLTRDHDGVAFDVSSVSITSDGVRVGRSDDPDAVVVGVNRDFLRQALAAGDQLVLGLDDPITPLAVRHPGREGTMSILMPVRLDRPA
ncbi:DNA polymerase III subunit beta family protein [Jatrophihabitans sp. YIM 134969]